MKSSPAGPDEAPSRRNDRTSRQNPTVSRDDHDPEKDESTAAVDGSVGEKDEAEPAADGTVDGSVGKNDIAWPIPEWAMWPLAAGLSGLMLWAFGFDWVLVSVIPFVVFLAVMTVIDLRELRIPDKLTRPAALLALPLLGLSLASDWSDISIITAVLGALAMGAFYFILFFIYPAGMGFGDVKLSPIIGAQLGLFGWIPLVRALLAAYLIVGPIALLLLIFRRAQMKTGFPFGPFMAAGAVVALVLEARGY